VSRHQSGWYLSYALNLPYYAASFVCWVFHKKDIPRLTSLPRWFQETKFAAFVSAPQLESCGTLLIVYAAGMLIDYTVTATLSHNYYSRSSFKSVMSYEVDTAFCSPGCKANSF
jgi:hypothetical protein